ncbi:L-threonine 3-dehydrogenase [Paramicrobacterium agarici]|uniref:L-threonine 3-dehydrogenase n=1 Tax=Paramicrobacterium agarici TaxID=630514 RepID=UPI001152F295|nr:L-threonine 3-dehydrogenase [Microbacterium agarici]TQO22790.1 L-threonine 3-dehydrogenase [Microbacterium agarici]
MKALYKAGPTAGFDIVERPEPEAAPDEVKIRVLRTGICGTDLHILRWDDWAASAVTHPLIPGHEFCGEVVDVGELVKGVSVGDLVSGEGHIVCGVCRNCRAGRRQMCIRTQGIGVNRDGAFAEYVTLPGTNVWTHNADIDKDVAAIFDPLGNAVHTAMSFPVVGEDVLITGCGPIGLMAIAITRHIGARFIVATDVSDERLELALSMGADRAINPARDSIHDAFTSLDMHEGFDVGFEMSGASAAMRQMIDNINNGGRIAMLGLPSEPFSIDWGSVVTRMLTLKGIYGREMFDTWNAMTAMLQSSETLAASIGSIVSDRFAARDWQSAFETAANAGGGKVVMDWTEI